LSDPNDENTDPQLIPAHSLTDDISPDVLGILNCLGDPAILLDRGYRIIHANTAYRDVYGEEALREHRYCYAVSHRYSVPCDQAGESCPLKQSMATGENSRVLHVHHTPRGEEYVNVEMWPVKDPVSNAVRYFVEVLRPSSVASAAASPEGLVGRSPAFQRTLELVERVAPSTASVMLLGESGTGKELIAQALHRLSPRAGGPFVPVECTGLPDSLFESELFGYVRGAFTGATRDKPGLVEAATGGTLFIDEVGDIPLSEQVKLLRLLETRRFRRVGSTEERESDFRLVCATNRDLAAMVRERSFREDLYYRLNVFEIQLPPLRARKEDLEALVASMLERIVPERPVQLSSSALEALRAYDFPGNVRELRNILERAVLLCDEAKIRPEHLPAQLVDRGATQMPVATPDLVPAQLTERAASGGGGVITEEVVPLAEAERRYLRRAVASHQGDRRSLAQRLGISERALYRKLKALE
jgi:transcriptional regulator with PAS, ATPase and Fis domain